MSFLRPVSDLRPGDHACLVYDSFASRDELVVSFLGEGLAHGEKVIYIADGAEERVREELEARARPGQLTVVDGAQAYFAAGAFEPDRVLGDLRETIESCLTSFPLVRAAGGPPATITSNGWSHELSGYERRANDLFATGTFSAVCAYDVRRTPATALLRILDAHPIVFFDVEPDARLQLERPSHSQLKARGAIDITTLGGLVGALADAIEAGDDVEIDLEQVDFVDVAGWRLLAEAVDLLHSSGHCLRLCATPCWAPSILGILGYSQREGLVLQ
jgi:anti-anti-sigma regulatory factor